MAGDVKIKWFGKKVSELATQVGLDAMNRAAFLLEGDIKKSMARTRRDFSVSRRRGVHFHHPSLVGSPPAPDTGILISSINHEIEVDARYRASWIGQGPVSQPTEAQVADPAKSIPDQIERLARLRDAGHISAEEYEAKKAELLDRM